MSSPQSGFCYGNHWFDVTVGKETVPCIICMDIEWPDQALCRSVCGHQLVRWMCLCRVAHGLVGLMYYSRAAAVDRVCSDVCDVLTFCTVGSLLIVQLTSLLLS